MIIFDTETTGLVQPLSVPLHQQPHIIEFAAMKLDDKDLNKVTGKIFFLCKSPVLIDSKITKITGITNKDLENKPPFVSFYMDLCDFFLGEKILVAHNLTFDLSLLSYELERIGRKLKFPFPPVQICTVEASFPIEKRRLKLKELCKYAFGREHENQHRAMGDVEALCGCVRWLVKQGNIDLARAR